MKSPLVQSPARQGRSGPYIANGTYAGVAALTDQLYSLKSGFNKGELEVSLARLKRLAALGERAQPKLNQPSFFSRVDEDIRIQWTGEATKNDFRSRTREDRQPLLRHRAT